ncbi:YveK family protein [Sphaerisporangium aureirubrum]|uniref:Polysaccharide chain length determinant N-terminal domain-containing protein n=1 Tax=Sphaerisporangium aureirubrum TaxID=1544736 RepID=A0ABW1N845_9ACTN
MDLLDSLRALLKRWPVTVALLVATIAATFGAMTAIPWQYESKATVVFLSSRKGAQPVGGNPWLAFDGSLTITAEVIARGMSDERTLQKLKDQGNTAEFTVGLAQDSRGPLLDITATAPDPKVAQATMEALATLSAQRLNEMQQKSSILPDATIRAELVTSTDKAELTPEKKIRMLLIIFAGGCLLTLGIPLFLESQAQKRRRQSQPDQPPTHVGPPPAGMSHSQRASRTPAGGPRPTGPTVPRSRPPARVQRSIDPPEPRLYDRRIGSPPPSTGKHGSPAEPRDPWDRASDPDDEFTTQIPVVKASEDLYVWTDDKDRPRGAPPASSGRQESKGKRSSSRGSSSGSGKAPQNGAGDEPYVVFDPTTPGR